MPLGSRTNSEFSGVMIPRVAFRLNKKKISDSFLLTKGLFINDHIGGELDKDQESK